MRPYESTEFRVGTSESLIELAAIRPCSAGSPVNDVRIRFLGSPNVVAGGAVGG